MKDYTVPMHMAAFVSLACEYIYVVSLPEHRLQTIHEVIQIRAVISQIVE